jgi:hypothetical protein
LHHRLKLGSEEIPYLLRRSPRRRSIGLKIDSSGLTVSVPARLPQREWEALLREKSAWVRDKLEEMRARALPPLHWTDGQLLPFLGRPLELALEMGGPRARPVQCDSLLRVALPDPDDARAIENKVVEWYRREALSFFYERVNFHTRQLDVSVSRLSLTSARTRWGSCTSRGAIRLNWRLIKAPPAVIDYVVVHELAHLIELNHSPAFWRIVASACPDFRDQRAFLRAHGAAYHQF